MPRLPNALARLADAIEALVDRIGRVMAWLVLAIVFLLFLQSPLREYLGLGGDPVWLAVMFAITIQTGFMMPPSGFAICFLRSVAPPEVKTQEIYLGVVPLIAVQVMVLVMLWTFPSIATWLPRALYGH